MSTILSARYHQSKSHCTVMKRKGKRGGQRKFTTDKSIPHLNVLEIAQDKSVKQTVSRNSGKSINDRRHGNNGGKIIRFFQSSIQVRY